MKESMIMVISGLVRNTPRFLFIVLLHIVLVSCASNAGMDAYRRGNYNEAFNKFSGDDSPEGYFARGIMYYKGEGVTRDVTEAANLSRLAADRGHAGAQYNLGLFYLKGIWFERNEQDAALWFRKAAEQGNAEAQTCVGVMYARGVGIARNREEAMVWLKKAADQGHDKAGRYLKTMARDSAKSR